MFLYSDCKLYINQLFLFTLIGTINLVYSIIHYEIILIVIIHKHVNKLRTSIEFKAITNQQQPDLNNYAQNELLITTVITFQAILCAGMDARS